MSSLDQILEVLSKNRDDKKAEINTQFEKKSLWLSSQLEIIRQLIQQDPRNDDSLPFGAPVQPISSHSSDLSIPSSKKRKSPETSEELKLSPDQKRTSVDVKDLAVAAGLPADWTKMKKEQLLEELRKRGHTGFSMKNLKQELVEALERVISSESRSASSDPFDNITPAAEERPPEPCIQEPVVPLEAKSRRPGSLLEQVRERVYNNIQVDTATAPTRQSIANEFRIRQERHRDSVARRSQVHMLPTMDNSDRTEAGSEVPSTEMITSPVRPTSAPDSVSDPTPEPTTTDESKMLDIGGAEQVNESAASEDEEDAEDEEQEEASETEESEEVDELQLSQKSNASEQSESGKPASGLPMQKKPANLVSSHSSQPMSFLDKNTKPVVASLVKAKQLKEKEEEKAQKKKDAKLVKAFTGGAAGAQTGSGARSPWSKVKSLIKPFVKPIAPVSTKPAFDVRVTSESRSSTVSTTAETAVPAQITPAPPVREVAVAAPIAPPAEVVVVPTAPTPAIPAPPTTSDTSPTSTHVVPSVSSPAPSLPSKSSVQAIVAKYQDAIGASSHSQHSAARMLSPAKPTVAGTAVQHVQPAVHAGLQPAEPHILREKAASPAPLAPPAPLAAPVEAVVQEEEEEYDPSNNYPIEDRDSDSDASGTDDEEAASRKKEMVPTWARGDNLREALERQYGLNGHTPMDPDLIFPEVQSCSLEDIFGKREGLSRKYHVRTSSAHWDADELTLVEKRQYRVHMGFDTPAGTTVAATPSHMRAQPVKLH